MDRIAIKGGDGGLSGEIPISGAKNSAIKLMAASLLTDKPLRLTNMPRLADTRFLGKLLAPPRRHGGRRCVGEGRAGNHAAYARDRRPPIAPHDLVREMRASFNVLGPLLARSATGEGFSLPGGCIPSAARPVNFHLDALKPNSAPPSIINGGYVFAQAPRGLKGGHIVFPSSSRWGPPSMCCWPPCWPGATR